MRVVRPVVRSFKARFVKEAAAWVDAGGHAVLWLAPNRARLVFREPPDDDDHDLGRWSALDIGRLEYGVARRGPLAGKAVVPVPPDCYAIVRARIVRDSIYSDPKRTIDFDCLACGACCRDNRVVLEEADLARFEKAGRSDLARPPYAKRDDGAVVLVLQRDKRCKHLAGDNKCGVYAMRPDACSVFPVGSECCLSSREEELGLVDGASA